MFILSFDYNMNIMPRNSKRKTELDKQRTEWRKKHRTLNGRIILYPDKQAEHINARGSKLYNWFWKEILMKSQPQNIPAIISALKIDIKNESEKSRIRFYRTMIGMAEDAYQFKQLENIKEYDTELQIDANPVFNSDSGIIYRNGKMFTTDYNQDETSILIRDIEGLLLDVLNSDEHNVEDGVKTNRNNKYKNWDYLNSLRQQKD
jgi:hypothetical protein